MKRNTIQPGSIFTNGTERAIFHSIQDGPCGHLFGFFSGIAETGGYAPTFWGARLSKFRKDWRLVASGVSFPPSAYLSNTKRRAAFGALAHV
jgi:hypothetical protein